MKTIILTLVLATTMSAATAADKKKLFSGPQPGEKLTSFKVIQVTGADKAETVSIVNSKDKQATLVVFLHKLTEPALGMMITLEWYANKQKDLRSHFVLLTDDKSKTETRVKRWWRRPFFARTPMCISPDGLEGPGKYGLNRNVHMTVLIAKNNTVASNFALLGPNNTDTPKVLAALAKTLGKKAPKLETLREELRAERNRRRAKRLKQNAVFKLAPNDALGKLMVSLIYRERTLEADAQRISKQMSKWAGENAKKKSVLAKYCKAVLEKGYAKNRYAKEAIQKLAGSE